MTRYQEIHCKSALNRIDSRGGLDREYRQSFYKKLHHIKAGYGIPFMCRPAKPSDSRDDGQQLSLF